MPRKKKLALKNILLLFTLLSIAVSTKSQTTYFPPLSGSTWDTLSPGSLGWCQDKIDSLLDYIGANNSKAFITKF